MNRYELTRGENRTRVSLSAFPMGSDLVVTIYNENAHLGALALAEYDPKEQRVSCSVLTRLGHKDDVIAQKTAYLISKHTQKPSCVIAGIHLDNISQKELEQILENSRRLVDDFIFQI